MTILHFDASIEPCTCPRCGSSALQVHQRSDEGAAEPAVWNLREGYAASAGGKSETTRYACIRCQALGYRLLVRIRGNLRNNRLPDWPPPKAPAQWGERKREAHGHRK